MSQWYFSKNNQQQGPVSAEQLKQLAASGQLQPTDMVWKEGMGQWAEARKLKGLFPTETTPPLPPPVPTVAKTASPPIPVTAPAKGFFAAPAASPNPVSPPPVPGPIAKSLPKLPPILYTWPAVLALLAVCFPFGHYLVWTHPNWTRRRKMIWSGVWLALMPGIIITDAKQSANKARIAEANQLWTSGDKANAISKYHAAINNGIVYIDPNDRSLVVSRVLDFEAEKGRANEAKSIIAESLKENVALCPETTAGKALLAQFEADRLRVVEEEKASRAKQESSGGFVSSFGSWGKSAAYKKGYDNGPNLLPRCSVVVVWVNYLRSGSKGWRTSNR